MAWSNGNRFTCSPVGRGRADDWALSASHLSTLFHKIYIIENEYIFLWTPYLVSTAPTLNNMKIFVLLRW